MILQCPGCHKRLSLDDRHDGKMIKCPACGQQFRAGAPATRIPQPTGGAAAITPRSAPPPPQEGDPGFDVVDNDYDVVDETPAAEAPPPKPVKKAKANAETLKNAISPTQTQKVTVKESPRDEAEGDESRDDLDEEELRPKKKKKKKKRREPEPSGAWIPYAIGVACLILMIAGIALAGVLAGQGPLVLFVAVWLAIAIPISTVILIVSMILSSAIGGGIEFGEIHIVIPKAMGLLIVVNLIYMIPLLGWFLVIPVWWLGLMFLFRLDFWECRFLIFINWLLNSVCKWVVVGVVLAVLLNVGGKDMADDALTGGPRSSKNQKGQDAEAAKLFDDGSKELRDWLAKNEKRVIFGRSREQSVKISSELYALRAEKVWAGDPVEDTRFGFPITKRVIVELPRDKAIRKKIIDYHNQVATQTNSPDIDDEGQRYVVIDFEANDR